ncbi:MAG TPA: DUF1778 domain-containing protein [Candidatus Rifleibacterium sp.]|jgi:uncharacterized protein (DUF1778 family)|nr:DUF1778 domain-containing protein [Candidatus Rifleibacterium sp.]HNW12918.1 DUF1778 domain-containing protein [Candidatus Rifleibacterium sp.]HPW60449.1 DUF1778 domain-containing protein [Candidatus Rifleibacterium sp.]HQB84057.1 DUF1778 domain-containing protein [Candidatus Rifleibacterium sp.]
MPAARERLSIDVTPEERRRVKAVAALSGKSVKEFILESIREKIAREFEERDLVAMMTYPCSALETLWNNDQDAIYDED